MAPGWEAPMADERDEPELVGLGFHVEDLPVGRRFRTIGRTVTEADITAFVGATGMVEALFTDLDHAATESALPGRVAPGALVYSFAEGLVLNATGQHTGLAFLGMQLDVHRPTVAGDTIHVRCEVTASRLTSRPGRGIVTTRNEIVNQRGETVVTYTPTRMMKSRT
jgi:acyl dehydratase